MDKKDKFWKIFSLLALISFIIIGYLHARNNRYHKLLGDEYVLDSWTGMILSVDEIIIKQPAKS